jgi:hypothetical protein
VEGVYNVRTELDNFVLHSRVPMSMSHGFLEELITCVKDLVGKDKDFKDCFLQVFKSKDYDKRSQEEIGRHAKFD